MADNVTVKVRGLAELAQGSRILAGNIAESAGEAFLGVAEQVAGQVNVPRRTGRLASSVDAREQQGGAIVTMGDGVPYAGFVEYGGRGHPHSPQGNYLYPAAIHAESLLVAAGERTASQEIGRMRWPSP